MKLLTPETSCRTNWTQVKASWDQSQSAAWMQLRLSSSTTLRSICDTTIERCSGPHRDQRMFLEKHGQIQECDVQILVFAFESYISKILNRCPYLCQSKNDLFVFTLQGFQGMPGHPGPAGERGPSGPVGPTVRQGTHLKYMLVYPSYLCIKQPNKCDWQT